MTKLTRTLFALLLTGFSVCAQEDTAGAEEASSTTQTESSDWKPAETKPHSNIRDNLFFGGYLRLSFGSYSVLGIEPMAGYTWSDKLSTGAKFRYDYIKDSRYSETYTTSSYGGSIFGRYRITPKFYAQLEPASYNYELFYSDGSSEREWVPYVFAGGGYVQPLGESSWVYVEILFDLLQDDHSPYDDWAPFFSIGAGTGF